MVHNAEACIFYSTDDMYKLRRNNNIPPPQNYLKKLSIKTQLSVILLRKPTS